MLTGFQVNADRMARTALQSSLPFRTLLLPETVPRLLLTFPHRAAHSCLYAFRFFIVRQTPVLCDYWVRVCILPVFG